MTELLSPADTMTPALKISGLHKRYKNGFEALKGIDLEVNQGDFFALLGPNGAGKSTTIGIICSLLRKTDGKVEIFGKDIDQEHALAKANIGIVPQEFNFNHFDKVFDVVVTQAGYYGLPLSQAKKRTEKYLRKLELWDKKDTTSRLLSGGMKRRLMIARALVHEPRLLILDEPTAGVDIELRRSMWRFLQEINRAGTTIILTTHYLEEAESLCRSIAIIDHGIIVEHTSMRALLRQLHNEWFILDTRDVLPEDLKFDGYPVRIIDSHSLEVELDSKQSLNDLFSQLSSKGINIVSMKNKSNRLEELFVSLVNSKGDR
jgi:ABC-2 type transport system ATP-binding protein